MPFFRSLLGGFQFAGVGASAFLLILVVTAVAFVTTRNLVVGAMACAVPYLLLMILNTLGKPFLLTDAIRYKFGKKVFVASEIGDDYERA